VLGAGQLGRMLALAGYPLGLRFRFFDPAPDSPAGQVAAQVAAEYNDSEALRRFVEGVDVITYEFENVPVETVRWLEPFAPVYPPPRALHVAQDRLHEKMLLRDLNIPIPPFAPVNSLDELRAAVQQIGLPAVLKTRRLGYDGKGQRILRASSDIDDTWYELGGVPLLLEGFVPFEREVSLIAVCGRDGATAFYPLIENEHRDGILRVSTALHPSPILQSRAESYAARILAALEYVGVVAIEFFERDGQLLANEMAPRVHNSGHWTIEGATTSQFENHLRAILGWPLGDTTMRGFAAMVNLIGVLPQAEAVLGIAGAHVHWYGKTPRAGRKLGHVTVCADDLHLLTERLDSVKALLET
jgi:5-(carboxyamino)imidazole ribonucleotide synthase